MCNDVYQIALPGVMSVEMLFPCVDTGKRQDAHRTPEVAIGVGGGRAGEADNGQGGGNLMTAEWEQEYRVYEYIAIHMHMKLHISCAWTCDEWSLLIAECTKLGSAVQDWNFPLTGRSGVSVARRLACLLGLAPELSPLLGVWAVMEEEACNRNK